MCMERYTRLIAGTFVLVSLLLARLHSPYWLLFTAFVGFNLFQSALTRWCLVEDILAKLGVPPCRHDGPAKGAASGQSDSAR